MNRSFNINKTLTISKNGFWTTLYTVYRIECPVISPAWFLPSVHAWWYARGCLSRGLSRQRRSDAHHPYTDWRRWRRCHLWTVVNGTIDMGCLVSSTVVLCHLDCEADIGLQSSAMLQLIRNQDLRINEGIVLQHCHVLTLYSCSEFSD